MLASGPDTSSLHLTALDELGLEAQLLAVQWAEVIQTFKVYQPLDGVVFRRV